jgi:hypothetical protein
MFPSWRITVKVNELQRRRTIYSILITKVISVAQNSSISVYTCSNSKQHTFLLVSVPFRPCDNMRSLFPCTRLPLFLIATLFQHSNKPSRSATDKKWVCIVINKESAWVSKIYSPPKFLWVSEQCSLTHTERQTIKISRLGTSHFGIYSRNKTIV